MNAQKPEPPGVTHRKWETVVAIVIIVAVSALYVIGVFNGVLGGVS